MTDQPMRIRMTYAKLGNLRFTGHLDLQRLFERALRRTNLPLRYTQGFSPHLRINLASALPLGFIGKAEQMDFWLDEEVSLEEISIRLRASLPTELVIKDLRAVDNQKPSLQGSLLSSEYEVLLPADLDIVALRLRADDLLVQDTLLVQRRKKTVDLKNFILGMELIKAEPQSLLKVAMKSTPEENGRPDELLELMGLDPADCQVTRTKLNFLEE